MKTEREGERERGMGNERERGDDRVGAILVRFSRGKKDESPSMIPSSKEREREMIIVEREGGEGEREGEGEASFLPSIQTFHYESLQSDVYVNFLFSLLSFSLNGHFHIDSLWRWKIIYIVQSRLRRRKEGGGREGGVREEEGVACFDSNGKDEEEHQSMHTEHLQI